MPTSYMRKDPKANKKEIHKSDFQLELAHGLIAGCSSRKQRSDILQYLTLRPAINESSHGNVNNGSNKKKESRDLNAI